MTVFRKLMPLLLCLSAAMPTLSHAATPAEQAFAAGQALANGAQTGTAAGVTNGSVANTVNSFNPSYYQYSTTAPQASLFLGGNGDTLSAGSGKVTACQTGAANPDKFLQQNCDAINFMAKNPTTRPQFTINPNDPNIVKSKAIQANPATLAANSLGYTSPAAIGAFTGCTNKTVTTPATFTTEVCNDFNSVTSQTCTIGRVVTVNANTNYQCNKTANAYQTQTCNRTLNAVVTQPPSVPATVTTTSTGWMVRYSWIATACPGKEIYSSPLWLTFYMGLGTSYSYYRCDLTAYSCPAKGYTLSGTTCIPVPVITSSWINGCATQQAAAL